MKPIQGIVASGRINVADPIDWPEGTLVYIQPLHLLESCEEEFLDLQRLEAHQGDDPASVAQWLAEFDAIPPLDMTSQEESQWRAARDEQLQFDDERQDRRLDSLRRTLP